MNNVPNGEWIDFEGFYVIPPNTAAFIFDGSVLFDGSVYSSMMTIPARKEQCAIRSHGLVEMILVPIDVAAPAQVAAPVEEAPVVEDHDDADSND